MLPVNEVKICSRYTCLISTYLFCSISAAFSERRGLHVLRQYSTYLYISKSMHIKSLYNFAWKQKNANPATPFQPVFSFIDLGVLVGSSLSTTGMHLNDVVCYSLHFLEVRLALQVKSTYAMWKKPIVSYLILLIHSDIFNNKDKIKSRKDSCLQINVILCSLMNRKQPFIKDYPDQ
jgi:hypothetical protein